MAKTGPNSDKTGKTRPNSVKTGKTRPNRTPGPVPRGTTRVRTTLYHPHTPGTTPPPGTTTPCTTTRRCHHHAVSGPLCLSVFRKLTPMGCLEKPLSAYIRHHETCLTDWARVTGPGTLCLAHVLAKNQWFWLKSGFWLNYG